MGLGQGSGHGSGRSTRTYLPFMIFVLCFLVTAIVLGIISIATPHWIDTSIARNDLTSDNIRPLAYSRYQGLFRTCYTGGILAILSQETQGRNTLYDRFIAGSSMCVFEEAYRVFGTDIRYDGTYVRRAHVLRATLASLVIGHIFILISVLMSLCAMCSTNKGVLCGVGVVSTIGVLLLMTGMALFTWVYFIQYQELAANYVEFWNGFRVSITYQRWVPLASINFGWSYLVGWISVLFALIGTIGTYGGMCCVDASLYGGMMPGQAMVKRQQVQQFQPEPQVEYIPQQEIVIAPARPRQQQVQFVDTTSANSTFTSYEAPPAYYNQGIVYRPENVTGSRTVIPNGIRNGNGGIGYGKNGNGNGGVVYSNGNGSAGYGKARIYNDAGASFTPREYIEAEKIIEFS